MTATGFQRARSADAKQQREQAILDAARRLGTERGIRTVTLTEIADAVGMHKSALLRYFETREQIFLLLTASGWREWSAALRERLAGIEAPSEASSADSPAVAKAAAAEASTADTDAVDSDAADTARTTAMIADAFAVTLTSRPMFCDLLAQAPLNLERNVSLESVRAFKLVTLEEVDAIGAELRRLLGISEQQVVDAIATATSMAGALWQMATPGPAVEELYRSDPRLAHAVVEVAPRLRRVLTAQLDGLSG